MAVIYLRSTDGNDSDDGSTWALAKATLAAALTAAGAGGIVYVAHDHAESQDLVMTLTSPGTAAAPTLVICVNDNAAPPDTLATTATVSTGAGAYYFTLAGFAYCYGVTFQAGVGSINATNFLFQSTSPWWWKFDTCGLYINGTNSGAKILVGDPAANADDQLLELVNTSVRFANAGQTIAPQCRIRWTNSVAIAAGGTLPTTLFTPVAGLPATKVEVLGVDLSALGSGQNLVNAGIGTQGVFNFRNCKLGSSVSVINGTAIPGQGGVEVDLDNCDSADPSSGMRCES